MALHKMSAGCVVGYQARGWYGGLHWRQGLVLPSLSQCVLWQVAKARSLSIFFICKMGTVTPDQSTHRIIAKTN